MNENEQAKERAERCIHEWHGPEVVITVDGEPTELVGRRENQERVITHAWVASYALVDGRKGLATVLRDARGWHCVEVQAPRA